MAKRETKAPKKKTRKKPRKYVVVKNKAYGKELQGVKIHWEGKRPKGLREDGSIQFGKHILELLTATFDRFRWIITEKESSVVVKYGITQVRTHQSMLQRMSRENWDRSRDIKTDIVRRFFGISFPPYFGAAKTPTYVPGTIATIVEKGIIPRLSSEDKDALNSFIPSYAAAEASAAVSQLKAAAEIQSLEALAEYLKEHIERSHGESWWQSFVKANILLMQQGYIKALPKFNVAIGETKFPDFCLVTHDNYLDILEIKKPDVAILKLDGSRGNYYWGPELAKAISQTENYIEQVTTKAADVRTYLLDNENIDIKAVRPRGIILAGNARTFTNQKQRDDFRLLSQGSKYIIVLTYDELLARLTNYIAVLRQYQSTAKKPGKDQRTKRSAK